jgi:signal transduction histidine kinase
MIKDVHIIIVQAMQLSVVLFLILFSGRSRIGNVIPIRRNKSLNIPGDAVKYYSLSLIALGFAFNFLYLLAKIGSYLPDVDRFHLNDRVSSPLILLLDVLTISCFVLGSINITSVTSAISPNKMPVLLRWDKLLLVRMLIIMLAAFVVVYTNWNNHGNSNYFLYCFNFLGYLFTSVWLLKSFTLERINPPKKVKRNYYVFIGFIIWAALQLSGLFLPLVLNVENVEMWIEWIGFGLSLVSKCLILFGLYNFSAKMASYAAAELITVNEKLKHNEAEMVKNFYHLESHSKKTQRLHKLIEQIYGLDKNEKVISMMLHHLLYSEIFNFDYAIFSEVDKFQEFIFHKDGDSMCRSSQIRGIKNWVKKGGFSLNHQDIMAQTVKKDDIFYVKGNIVNGEEIDIEDPLSILRKDVYYVYGHDRVDRMFIPISNRDRLSEQNADQQDIVDKTEIIGIVEVGYSIDSQHYSASLLTNKTNELFIYLFNLAKNYLRNREAEESNIIDKDIEELGKGVNHIGFMQRVLFKCAEDLKVTYGDVSFLSLDDEQFELEGELIYGEARANAVKKIRLNNDKLTNPKKGIFRHVADLKAPYFANNVSIDPYYIADFPNVKSQLSVPIVYLGTVLGVVSLCASDKDYFNELKKNYVAKIIERATEVFMRLKISNATSSLVIPYSMYDRQKIYESTFERIRKYYACNYLTLWEGNEENNNIYRIAFTTDKSLEANKSLAILSDFERNIFKLGGPQNVFLQDTKNPSLNKLEQYAASNFQTLIYVPVGRNKGISRFITLFSKVKVEHLFPEDKIFFGQISTKLILSLNFFELYSFFDKLTSENYARHKDEILRDFTEPIKRISGADILLLFTFDPEQRKFIKSIKPQGNLRDKKLLDRLDSVEITGNDFSYSIIENGSQWIENDEQYIAYRQKQAEWKGWGVFEQDFWQREKIKSLAAVRVEFEGKPLGVMFFNFREERQQFRSTDNKKDSENQAWIKLLANLVGRVIKISNTVEEERLLLSRETTETFQMALSEAAIGMIHNVKNLYTDISYKYDFLKQELEKTTVMQDDNVYDSLTDLGESIFGFQTDYLLYRSYLDFNNFKVESHYAEELFSDLRKIFIFQHRRKPVALKMDTFSDALTLDCDKVQFVHVVLNIVKNAVEAFASTIWIKITEFDSTRQYRVIEIQNNGIGIKDEDKPKIFLPAYTTKQHGTGMGLPVCRRVIERHGGRIDFNSTYNKNKSSFTNFSIYLPIK